MRCAWARSEHASVAQSRRKVPRVGLLIPESLSDGFEANRLNALRAGLHDNGYVEGKNIALEIRSAEGNYDRLPELATDLAVTLNVDVIVAFGTKAVLGIDIPQSMLVRANEVIQ